MRPTFYPPSRSTSTDRNWSELLDLADPARHEAALDTTGRIVQITKPPRTPTEGEKPR